jgi:hypothetical protein
MARGTWRTPRIRYPGEAAFDCQPLRDPGVACSRLVGLSSLDKINPLIELRAGCPSAMSGERRTLCLRRESAHRGTP